MYLTKTPKFIKKVFSKLIWEIPNSNSEIYLSFDDGPNEKSTRWILEQLKYYNAKAIFFCIGKQVEQFPDLYDEILLEGHSIGNHGYNHLSGWKTKNMPYFLDVRKGAQLTNSRLFRPPFGRVKLSQMSYLQRHYKIVMWDIMPGDFDKKLNTERSLQNAVRYTKQGSIVVFHDNEQSFEKLKVLLPGYIEGCLNLGFKFKLIDNLSVGSAFNGNKKYFASL